jgi:hypothetical protein
MKRDKIYFWGVKKATLKASKDQKQNVKKIGRASVIDLIFI